MQKTIKAITEYGIQFSDEELEELGWGPGQKLFIEEREDGSISLSPGESIELDLADFDKQTLMIFIDEMAKMNMDPHEYFNYVLKQAIERIERAENERINTRG